jgi:hypothetical protein
MNISGNIIYLHNADIYVIIKDCNDIKDMDDIYILLEHMLTGWKCVDYNKYINDKSVTKRQLLMFFTRILSGIDRIFLVDKNHQPLYYVQVGGESIDELVKIVI